MTSKQDVGLAGITGFHPGKNERDVIPKLLEHMSSINAVECPTKFKNGPTFVSRGRGKVFGDRVYDNLTPPFNTNP